MNPNHFLNQLRILVDDEANTNKKTNLGLNFGNNNISIITDVSFNNNKRVGEKVVSVQHPTDTLNGEGTFFSPSEQGRDDNYWIEFYSAKKTNAFGYKVYNNTGRAAKCSIVIDENGNPKYELEKNANGENIYYYDESIAPLI